MMDWTTKLERARWLDEHTNYFAEIHTAWFSPKGWPGIGKVVSLGIPECELHRCLVWDREHPVMVVNQPEANRDVGYWLKVACDYAVEDKAPLILNCDTIQQLADAVVLAEKLLPRSYKRVPLERLYDPQDRVDRPVS
jgi:hypothetical protein